MNEYILMVFYESERVYGYKLKVHFYSVKLLESLQFNLQVTIKRIPRVIQ